MITTGSKFYFGVAGLAYAAALIFGLSTGGHLWGVLSFGYKGGVGDHLGYSILMLLSVAAFLIGSVVVAFRDADADVVATVAGTETVPEVHPPRNASFWPVVAAFSGGLMILGLATSPALFVIGAIIGVIAAIEWTLTAWADRATGDPEVNAMVRDRLMKPLEVPMLAVGGIGIVVLAFSRLLLAVSKTGSVVVGLVFGVLIVAAGFAVAYRPHIGRSLVTAVIAFFAVTILGSGIYGAAQGEREFEIHGEHGEEGEHGEDGEHSEDEEHSEDGEEHSDESEEGLEAGSGSNEVGQ